MNVICGICLDNCTQKESKTLCCLHTFHQECVQNLYKYNINKCPMCRSIFTPASNTIDIDWINSYNQVFDEEIQFDLFLEESLRILENIEENIQENIEENIQKNIEENIQEDIEEDIEENIEENIEKDIFENFICDISENMSGTLFFLDHC